jgi:hypothetical protein
MEGKGGHKLGSLGTPLQGLWRGLELLGGAALNWGALRFSFIAAL